jgi:hypothetical protein
MLSEIDLPELEEEGPVAQPQIVLPAGVAVDEAPEPEPAVEPGPGPEPEPIPTDYQLPDEMVELLAEPDEPDDEPEPYEPAAYEAPDEYEDPQVTEMRRRAEAAERKAAHERELRVKASRKDWEAEARRVFRLGEVPLLTDDEIAGIRADSRKGFIREAKAVADRNKQVALRFAPQPATPEPAAGTADEEQIRADERERVLAEMWGRPPGGGTPAPSNSGQAERLARARRSGNLKDIMKARIFPDG